MTDSRPPLDLAAIDAAIARIEAVLEPPLHTQRQRVHLGPPSALQLHQMADQIEHGPDGYHFAEALRTAALDAAPADQPGLLARAIHRIFG